MTLNEFVESWQEDELGLKPAFLRYREYLAGLPGVSLEFLGRPGISYSLRAKSEARSKRPLFVLVDVVDDEPAARWLSVCFYADMVTDPEEQGDFVPQGLLGEDALCFNLDENNDKVRDYIGERIREAAVAAA